MNPKQSHALNEICFIMETWACMSKTKGTDSSNHSNTLGDTFEDSILCIWQIYSKILIEFDPVEFLFVSFYLLAFQAIDQRFQRMHPLLARLRCPER